MWHGRLWMIDHGAAMYFHHGTSDFLSRARDPFTAVKDHVLLRFADALEEADTLLCPRLTREAVERVVALVPPEWSPEPARYTGYFMARLASPRAFVEEAIRARSQHL
jgi:hypothetical protein